MMKAHFLGVLFLSLTMSFQTLAGPEFKGTYAGKINLSSPLLGATDQCEVDVAVRSQGNKIVIERIAKQCDRYKLKQKKAKYEFDIRGETLNFKEARVGSLKEGYLFARLDIDGAFSYQLDIKNVGSKSISYSEKVFKSEGITSDLAIDVEGPLNLK